MLNSIEKSILDKLGKNEVIFDESDGFTNKKGKWITYEEITDDSRPIQTKEVLGVRVGSRSIMNHGKYTLRHGQRLMTCY